MELILHATNGSTMTIIAIIVLIVLAFYAGSVWLRRRFAGSPQMSRRTVTPHAPLAARIALRPIETVVWPHPKQVQELSKLLQKLGFKSLGDFSITQMPDRYLRVMGQPGKELAALIYDHPLTMPLFEVAVFYRDNTSLTVSSQALADLQDHPPQDNFVVQTALKPKQALELITQYDSGKARKTIDRNRIVEEVQNTYARRMDWRIKRGSLSEEFVAFTAQAINALDLSEDEMEMARLHSEAVMARMIEEACMDNFFRQSDLDAADWESLRTTLFVVHERMDREQIVETIATWLDGDKELHLIDLSESLYDVSGIDLFRQINQTLPEKQRMIEMGRIEEPLSACIYMAPA